MKRSIFTIWLPLVALACVAVVVNKVFFSDDNPNVSQESSAESSEASATNSDETKSIWQDLFSKADSTLEENSQSENLGSNAHEEGQLDTNGDMESPTWDKDAWEQSGNTLEERIKNLYRGEPLPEVKGRTTIRPMKYQRDFDRAMRTVRGQALESNSSAVWGTLKFTPEMIGEEVTGLRLDDREAAEFLEKNGLEDGDVITVINGKKVNSPEAAFDGMGVIGESENISLVIDRGGEIINLDINKNQMSK